MGYTFTFLTTAKRINSTKQPTGGTNYAVTFKRACSMENPVIYVNAAFETAPTYNYCYCSQTGKYYWVTDVVSLRNDLWEFHLEGDPLATFKDAIMATKAIILYGFNADSSGSVYRLQDSRQYVSNVPVVSVASEEFSNGIIDRAGCYILGCCGKSGVVNYALSLADLQNLLKSISTSWEDLAKQLTTWEEALPEFMSKYVFGGTAIENIRSCIWVPFAKSKFSGGTENIVLGLYDTGVSGQVVNADARETEDINIVIPWPVNDWKRMNCQLQLYIPFFGKMEVPINQCNDDTSINIRVGYSLIDGGVTCYAETSKGYIIYAGSTNLSAPYAVGASNIDIGQTISSVSGTVSSALQFGGAGAALGPAGAVAGAALGVMSGAGNVMQSIAPINTAIGTIAGRSALTLPTLLAKLVLYYYAPIDDPGYQGLYGFPVMRVGTPVKGYCRTQGFSCQPSGATMGEISAINSAMDSGVFIE